MTRKKEINLYLKERNIPFNSLEANSIIEGAEWADKTMIEKACKWLINIDFDDFHFRDCDESFNNDLFVDAFRKAMLEEE